MKTALERIHQKIDNILTDIINDHKQKRQTTKSAGNVKLEEEDLVDVLLNLQECAVLDFPPENWSIWNSTCYFKMFSPHFRVWN